jgi:hypothetical protein
MADKLITIAEFPDYIEAEMAQQLLADNGIKAVVTGENASNVYSGMPALGGYCKLEVFERQAQRAQQILDSKKTQEN